MRVTWPLWRPERGSDGWMGSFGTQITLATTSRRRLPPAPRRWSDNWCATRRDSPSPGLPPAPRRWSHNWCATRRDSPSPGLPPAPRRWSDNWCATRRDSPSPQAATGPAPVEPQLACYQRIHHHPGCHRPRASSYHTSCSQIVREKKEHGSVLPTLVVESLVQKCPKRWRGRRRAEVPTRAFVFQGSWSCGSRSRLATRSTGSFH